MLASAVTYANPKLEDGYDAFDRGDVQRAVTIWTTLAEQGDATAQLNLGQLYRLGNGVPQSDEEAVKWYVQAARNNSDVARYTLGLMHREGRASDQDLARAGLVFTHSQEQVPEPEPGPEDHSEKPENWLATLPADAYLVQVIAASNRPALEKYVSTQMPGTHPAPRIVQSTRDGSAWYQLMLGPFSSRTAAKDAIKALPKTVRENGAWVRTAASMNQ